MEESGGPIFEKVMDGVNAGIFREKVSFYRFTPIPNSSGGSNGANEGFLWSCLAGVKQKTGVRGDENNHLVITKYYMVKIRKAKDRTPEIDMMIRYKGNDYLIMDISEPDELNLIWNLIIVKS